MVSGETVIGANIFRDFTAGIRDLIGGRAKGYERSLTEAKQTAINEMIAQAQQLGANAVIGVDLDFETVSSNGSMLMVSASGTAVIIE